MKQKSNTVVGLDIGTTAVTVVVGEVKPGGAVDIIGVGSSPSRGLRKGVVINIEATVESISKAVQQAETMAGQQITSVWAGISGSHIQGQNSHGIVGIKHREVSLHDIQKVIEAAKAVAIPMDREILHVLPQEFIIDEQDGIKEPLGISGVRLESKVHIITGAVASGQNIVKCANRCGLAVKDIVLSSLASARAVVSPEEQELGVCLVDIGGGTTDLIVFHNGAVRHTSVLPIGGNHISNDIAAGLRTPIGSAEEIKCRSGAASVNQVRQDETVEVPSTGGRAPRVISKMVLAEIIEARVIELFSFAKKALERSECVDYIASGLVISGGTANLAGIDQVAEQVFNLPVRVGRPGGVGGLSDLVKSPEYATGIGLVLHAAQAVSQGAAAGAGMNFFSRTFKKVGNWFSEHL